MPLARCHAADDLTPLSDEFRSPSSRTNWHRLGQTERSANDALATFDLGGRDYPERLAKAEWQRDLWVSYWRLADHCEKSGQAEEALVWWRQVNSALAAMKQRGILLPTGEDHVAAFQAKRAA